MVNFRQIFLCVMILAVNGYSTLKKTETPQTFSNVSVRTSYDPKAQFPARGKYAFVKFAYDSERDPNFALLDQRIQTALADQLKKKGFKSGESGDVSFLVTYTVQLQHQINILAAKSKVEGNDWIGVLVIPNDYVSGALLVQIIDTRNMEPIWLGIFNADITLTSVSEQEKRQRVEYAVKELLKTFPPK